MNVKVFANVWVLIWVSAYVEGGRYMIRTVNPLRRRTQGECIVPLLMTTFLAFMVTLMPGLPFFLPQIPSTPIALDLVLSENKTRST